MAFIPHPKPLDFKTAEEFIAADEKWMAEKGWEIDDKEKRAASVRNAWIHAQESAMRRKGIWVPGDNKLRRFPKFTGLKYRYG